MILKVFQRHRDTGSSGLLQASELESYILRDTLKPWQLKVPGPKPISKQVKEARKGTDRPVREADRPIRGNWWRRKGSEPPKDRNQGPFYLTEMPLIEKVPLTAFIVGARAGLLTDGQKYKTPARVSNIPVYLAYPGPNTSNTSRIIAANRNMGDAGTFTTCSANEQRSKSTKTVAG